MAIQWKPLRDSHYIVASLQPGGGERRQIFAHQSALREIQAAASDDSRQPVVGLLLGERFDCSLTLTPYVVIESHVETSVASFDEHAIADAIRTLRGTIDRRNPTEVLGWYCSNPSGDLAVSRTHASVHAACFQERWQTILIFGDNGTTAAFYLYDGIESRWFQAPFFELPDPKVNVRGAKPTCVAWPAYLTTASVIPLAAAPQQVFPPSRRSSMATPILTPARHHPAKLARFIVTVRRTPANAIAGVGRAAVAVRRSVLDVARAVGGRVVRASRNAIGSIGRIRAKRAARAAQQRAEVEAARAREAERRAALAAERRAARAEAARRAAELEKQRAAEAEARRAAEAEARRRAEEEAERLRAAEAEVRRQAAEAEARRQAEEAEARRAAEAETQRKAAEETERRAMEEEARRRPLEEEQRRAEAEALRISLAVAATRQRLARPPVEGSTDEAPRTTTGTADDEDTKASDRPDRYLALAMREGFEVSVKTERGDPEDPETFWLLHDHESGLRLVVVTTENAVRSASLHYNLRTEDDALLQGTVPEYRDLESRTIYGREECLDDLRARCRHLRATGALERDWKVVPVADRTASPS